MAQSLGQLVQLFQHEAAITLRLFHHLTDASLAQKVSPQDRSLGEIAWHIVTSIPAMLAHVGLAVPGPRHCDPVPASAQLLAQTYQDVTERAASAITSQWSDASLEEVHEVYGYRWTKAQTVMALLFHQTHHRGAMTVLMRQAGLTLPEIYGPTRDSHPQG